MQYFEMTNILVKNMDIAIANILGKDEYDEYENTPELLANLYTAKRIYEYYDNIYKFLKMSKNNFLKLANDNTASGDNIIHTVKSYESPLGIAKKYGVTIDSISDDNGKIPSNIKEGDNINIKVNNSKATKVLYQQVPTYGDHTGEKLYGNDLPPDLIEDNGTKDLLVLDEYTTLKQGIFNIVTTNNGEYPLNEEFGIMNLTQLELPNDLGDNLLKLKINDAIVKDSRIEKVISIISQRAGNSIIFEIEAMTILQQNVTIGV